MDGDRQPGTTACVILGLVAKRPMSGYDVAALAARSLDHFWPISKSQVYAALSGLEREGFIEGTHVAQERRPDKRRYALTGSGQAALDAWLRTPGYSSQRNRSGLLAKLFFADRMTHEQRIALLDRYRADADAYRQELRAIVDKLEGREDAAYGRATAIYGLRHTEAGIAWADDMIKALGDRADQVALEP